jgi:uncharacterized protein YukE
MPKRTVAQAIDAAANQISKTHAVMEGQSEFSELRSQLQLALRLLADASTELREIAESVTSADFQGGCAHCGAYLTGNGSCSIPCEASR